jgi:hypothetical protein
MVVDSENIEQAKGHPRILDQSTASGNLTFILYRFIPTFLPLSLLAFMLAVTCTVMY